MNEFEQGLSTHVQGLTPPVPPPYDGVVARRGRRRRRRRAFIAALGAGAAVVAIVGGAAALRDDDRADEPPVSAPDPSPRTGPGVPDEAPEWDGKGAPPIVLQLDGRQVSLNPWTSCYTSPPGDDGVSQGSCSDGAPTPPFEDVGERNEVPFSFPLKGWTFEASFSSADPHRCERTFTVPAEKTGAFTFAVPLAGPPGSYDVNVFGRGPEGDVITTFAWTTSETGFLPTPSGYAAIVADNDSELDSYGVEVGIDALAEDPRDASMTLTVTAANGRSTTIGPINQDERCAGDGTVSFVGEEADGKRAAGLGPAPFVYLVEVTLDGRTYIGTAVWPRDEEPDKAPYTTLTFEPPLPAYTG